MCAPVQRVHRDSTGVLTLIGDSTVDGIPLGLAIAEACAGYFRPL